MKKTILVNADSINVNNATGITLRSILSGFHANRFIEIYWTEKEFVADKYTLASFRLKYRILSLGQLLNGIRKSKVNLEIKKSTLGIDSRNGYIAKIRQLFITVLDESKLHISKKIKKQLDVFNPEVVYTLGGSYNALKLSYKISKKYNIPIVIHHMDNWLHCIQWEDNILLKPYLRRLRKITYKCYERTNLGLTISDKMAKDFTIEIGKQHYSIMNPVKNRQMCTKKELDMKEVIIIYAGGLHLNRFKQLIELAREMENYNQSYNYKYKLLVYTSNSDKGLYEKLFIKFDCVTFMEQVKHEHIFDVYNEADALLHVESETIQNIDYIKYSVSTKISEYLSSGKPLIYYGPSNIYLFELLSDNKIAIIIDKNKPIMKQIERIANAELMSDLTDRAYSFYLSHFTIDNARSTFEEVINSAVIDNGGRP